jgi:hypothetical protein
LLYPGAGILRGGLEAGCHWFVNRSGICGQPKGSGRLWDYSGSGCSEELGQTPTWFSDWNFGCDFCRPEGSFILGQNRLMSGICQVRLPGLGTWSSLKSAWVQVVVSDSRRELESFYCSWFQPGWCQVEGEVGGILDHWSSPGKDWWVEDGRVAGRRSDEPLVGLVLAH